jgi:hypothetical protein
VADYKKYLLDSSPKEVQLELWEDCSSCGCTQNPYCAKHNAEVEYLPIKVRQMPWSMRLQKVSLSVKWNEAGERFFDGSFYINESLKYMIVEAPWGKTDDMFLQFQVGDKLGAALEALVPAAFGEANTSPSIDDVKKVPTDSSEGSVEATP